MKIEWNGDIYPMVDYDKYDDEIVTTIAPDYTGDFILLEMHSQNGMKLLDFIAKDEVVIVV